MKLRALLNESKGLTVEQVKKRIPEAKNVITGGDYITGVKDIYFTYKGYEFVIHGVSKDLLFASDKRPSNEHKLIREVLDKLRIISKEEAKNNIETLKNKSTKLKKKSFKL